MTQGHHEGLCCAYKALVLSHLFLHHHKLMLTKLEVGPPQLQCSHMEWPPSDLQWQPLAPHLHRKLAYPDACSTPCDCNRWTKSYHLWPHPNESLQNHLKNQNK